MLVLSALEFAQIVHNASQGKSPMDVDLVRRLAFGVDRDVVEMSSEYGAMNDGYLEFIDAVKVNEDNIVVRMERFNYSRDLSGRVCMVVKSIMRDCRQFATAAVAELPERDTWTSMLILRGRRDRWEIKDLTGVQIQRSSRRNCFALAYRGALVVESGENVSLAVRRVRDLELLTRGAVITLGPNEVLVRPPYSVDAATWDGKVMRHYDLTGKHALKLTREVPTKDGALYLPRIDRQGVVMTGHLVRVTGTGDGVDVRSDLAGRREFPELGEAVSAFT